MQERLGYGRLVRALNPPKMIEVADTMGRTVESKLCNLERHMNERV